MVCYVYRAREEYLKIRHFYFFVKHISVKSSSSRRTTSCIKYNIYIMYTRIIFARNRSPSSSLLNASDLAYFDIA